MEVPPAQPLSPSVSAWLDHFQFGVAAWGYNRISINIFTTAGFYIFVTALACYLFRSKNANAAKDFVVASKRSGRSLATLGVGSAPVYLMVDSGQIAQLGKILASGGKFVYASYYPLVAFLGGMAFSQRLPGDFRFSRMQVSAITHRRSPVFASVLSQVTPRESTVIKKVAYDPAFLAHLRDQLSIKGIRRVVSHEPLSNVRPIIFLQFANVAPRTEV